MENDACFTSPVVLISRCLLGEACRYDGASRPASGLGLLPRHWTRLDLCPETDLGMGVPRPPVGLLEVAGALRLRERNGERDWTREMVGWCRFLARTLISDGAAGVVLKARSPSCGKGDVEVFSSTFAMGWPGPPDAALRRDADGLWTAALLAVDAALPMINEEDLSDAVKLRAFVGAVEARHSQVMPQARA